MASPLPSTGSSPMAADISGDMEAKQLRSVCAQLHTSLREVAELRDDFIGLARRQAALERVVCDAGGTTPRNDGKADLDTRVCAVEALMASVIGQQAGEDERLKSIEALLDQTSKSQPQSPSHSAAAVTRQTSVGDCRLIALEMLVNDVVSQQGHLLSELREFRDLPTEFAALRQRVDSITSLSVEGNVAAELERLRDLPRQCAALRERVDTVTPLLTEMDSLRKVPTEYAALRERLDGLAPLLAQASDARTADAKSVHEALGRHAEDIAGLRDAMASIEARAAATRADGVLVRGGGSGMRFAGMDGRMAALEERFSSLSRDVSRLEASRSATAALGVRLSAFEQDLADLSTKLGQECEALQHTIGEHKASAREAVDGSAEERAAERAALEEQTRAAREDCEALAARLDRHVEAQAGAERRFGAIEDRIAKVVEHHAVHAAASGAALEAHARDVAELRMAILQAVEEHERSSMETRDALGKLAAAAGSCDMEFEEYRALFESQAQIGQRLARFDLSIGDGVFWELLPERMSALEQRVVEVLERPVLREVLLPPLPIQQAVAVPGTLERGGALSARSSVSGTELLKALHSVVAHHIGMVNGRKHVAYDLRTRRAVFSVELSMKRRVFGSAHADEPSAEWENEGAAQPMLQDVAFLFRTFSKAAADLHRDNRVAATVLRTRNRFARQGRGLSPPNGQCSLGSARATLGGGADRATLWEVQLSQNRALLVKEALVGHGVPRDSLSAKVEHAAQNAWSVEFHFDFRGSLGIPGSVFNTSVDSRQ